MKKRRRKRKTKPVQAARAPRASPRRATVTWVVGGTVALAVVGVFLWSRRSAHRPDAPDRRGVPAVRAPTERWSDAAAVEAAPLPVPQDPLRDRVPTAVELRGEAGDLAEAILQRFPGNAGALAIRARVEYQLGKSQAAQEWWQRSLDAKPDYGPALRGLALVAADRGDYARAAQLRQSVWQLEPTSLQARTDLAEVLLKDGAPDEVVSLLESIDQTDPSAAMALYVRGQAELQLEHYAAAERSYAAAVRLRPDWHVAYYGLITALARMGRSEESAAYMSRFEETRRQSWRAQKDIRETYDDVHLMRQNLADAYTEAGDVYVRLGAQGDAERLWKRAAELDVQNVLCRSRLSTLYQRAGRDAEAVDVLQEVAALLPRNASCRVTLGMAQARTGAFDQAERSLRESIRLSPQDSTGYRELARLLIFVNRNLSEALSLAERAVLLEPNAENYAVLGASCEVNGDIPSAIKAVEHAMQLDPGNAEYARAHAALRRAK